jgi:hypothetical protein
MRSRDVRPVLVPVRTFVLALVSVLVLVATPSEAGAMWTWGVRLGSPQLLSASGGVLIGRIDAPEPPPGTPPEKPERMHVPIGLLLQVEPGVGGGKVAIGVAKGLPPVAGVGLKAFYLRTWGQPLWNERGRSYVGAEIDATIFLKVSIGVMRRVDGDGPKDTKLTGGIGFGF